mgnify:CR=1 FL=1
MSEAVSRRPLQRRGPLDGCTLAGPGVTVSALPTMQAFNLRGDPGRHTIDAALNDHLGISRPITPNTQQSGRRGTILWLGPDEWLVLPAEDAPIPEAELVAALHGECRLCAVGDGLARVCVEGPHARWLVSAGCPLDPHNPGLAAGGCAQTRLAQASVLITPDGLDRLVIHVRRSMAEYLWSWFNAAVARLETG